MLQKIITLILGASLATIALAAYPTKTVKVYSCPVVQTGVSYPDGNFGDNWVFTVSGDAQTGLTCDNHVTKVQVLPVPQQSEIYGMSCNYINEAATSTNPFNPPVCQGNTGNSSYYLTQRMHCASAVVKGGKVYCTLLA